MTNDRILSLENSFDVLFPKLHAIHRVFSGTFSNLNNDSEHPDSFWWNGAHIFTFKDMSMILVGNDTQAYWITRETGNLQINKEYKDFALPMRIGKHPLMNTPGVLPAPIISACKMGDSVYISNSNGVILSVSSYDGEKPIWNQEIKKPFGEVKKIFLYPKGNDIGAIVNLNDRMWTRSISHNKIDWINEADLLLENGEHPLFIKYPFLFTSMLQNDKTNRGCTR